MNVLAIVVLKSTIEAKLGSEPRSLYKACTACCGRSVHSQSTRCTDIGKRQILYKEGNIAGNYVVE